MFIHADINGKAPVCSSFGKLGYCEAGGACSSLHVYECPDFANNGSCDADKCPLRHVRNAGRMKPAASDSSGIASPEIKVDDEIYIGDKGDGVGSSDESQNHAITQQHDYVAFE